MFIKSTHKEQGMRAKFENGKVKGLVNWNRQ